MLDWQRYKKSRIFIKALCIILIVTFFSYDLVWAGAAEILPFKSLSSLPHVSFVTPTLKYLSVNEANPNNYFNFLVDKGQLSVTDKGILNKEAKQLINYFFLGLTLPDNVFWVNLKPLDSNRITSEQLSRTDLGRTLLEQDFQLKRDVSQYLNPQNPIGKKFWEELYSTLGKERVKKSGITTSNRVWIVPAEAVVIETEDGAFLAKSSLKVLLESEYAALKLKQNPQLLNESSSGNSDSLQYLTEQLMKEIVIPAITKDVNESQNYAPLRQIYHSLILAQWFKRKHKNTNSAYAQAINKGYIKGLESQLPWEKQEIWQDYLKSYKQGEYKIQDTIFGLKRMYFSGGVLFNLGVATTPLTIIGQKELAELQKKDPDFLSKLIKPDSFQNDLVVITERQGRQENPQEQPLLQGISVVSSPARSLEKAEIISKETKPEKQKVISKRINYKPFLNRIAAFTLALYLPSVALAQGKDVTTKGFSSFIEFFIHPVTMLVSSGLVAGYLIFRFIRKSAVKENRPFVGTVNPVFSMQPQAQFNRPLIRRPEIIIPQQSQDNISASLRYALEGGIQQFNDLVAQNSRDALVRSFRPIGLVELPLPMPLSMLNQDSTDRDKVVHILQNMQRMMDGTDEKVLRDFERAIDNARDRVTEQALNQYEGLSDEGLYRLLTDGYAAELQREFQRIVENQIQHMTRFHAPSTEEQALYVSEEINERYSRLPRYLKWILTNNSQLENDPLVQEWLNAIQRRMSQIPAFPDMITSYSETALNRSLYLNPEIAMRVILHLAKDITQDKSLTEGQIRRQIEFELARILPEDTIAVAPDTESEEIIFPELPIVSQARALPVPDTEKTASLTAQLNAILEDYNRFILRFDRQEALVSQTETDLAELSEGLEEARRQNDKIIIEALKPAVEGLVSKLSKAKEDFVRIEREKQRYEEIIKQLKMNLGETSSPVTLSAFDPLLAASAVFGVIFGMPLVIIKLVLDKWYNTRAAKILGLGAGAYAAGLGYFTYFVQLSPEIRQLFTDPSNANWLKLSTFFIIWTVVVFSGVLGGKIGKDISHKRLYRKANSQFKKGNFDEAITLLNQAVKLNPKNAAGYSLLAECQRNNKHFDDAIGSYKKALEIEPTNSATHNNLGVVYAEKGDTAKAIESYKRSLELDANDPVVLSNLGRSLHSKGQLLEAVRVFQRSQEIKPDSSITEELNQILTQTGNVPNSKKPQDLPYAKTLSESLRIEKEKGWVGQLVDNDGLTAIAWLGAISAWVIGGIFMHFVPFGQNWDLGTTENPKFLGVVVWFSEIVVAPLLGVGLSVLGVWVSEKVTNIVSTAYRFLKFPITYRTLQKVNLLPSDELSDSDLSIAAPVYARMSKEYLEKIIRSWMETGQEEKIARLFKFGKWDPDKTRIYGDVGEYKRVSRVAATKFATTAQEQKVIFDGIDREKEKLAQKGIKNAVGLIKDILPQITEHSRNRDEFWHWLSLVVSLPNNILGQGQRQVLVVFTDLREFDRAQEESFNKFGAVNQEASSKVRDAINGLVQKLEREGLNYPGILKKALVEINKAARNLDEFLFWINEAMRFDKQLWSSGGFLGLLQNLIAYVRVKEEASKKLCRNPEETSRLFQTVDSLREELKAKQVSGDVSMLKDVIPRVTEVSRNLAEFFEYIAVLKAFDKNMWRGTQSVLQAFNNHAAYRQARENAAAKFTQDDPSRQKFFSDIDNLRNQLVQKGFPQASDLLKDVLPELTKTCRSKEEFIYWLGELVGLNAAVWRNGVQTVVNNFNDLAGFKQAKEMALDKLCQNQQEKDELAGIIDSLRARLEEKRPSCSGLIKDIILEILKDIDSSASPQYRRTDFIWWLTMCVNFDTQTWAAGTKQVLAGYQELKEYIKQRRELSARFAINPEEQQRLTAVWDNLDKAADFTKPSSVSLLKNTLGKIANFASNPHEFVFWVGTLSELNNEVQEVFCRDIDTVFAYYKEKGKSRDFNHLSATLNQYHNTYHQTVLITANLLDTLTDSSLEINKRVEKVSQFLIEQKIVKLGAPPNLVGLRDAVSFDELIGIGDLGETGLRGLMQSPPIKKAMGRMGRDGLYTYYESQKPVYYQHFLEEANGLRPGFNRPGEKFRVAYRDRATNWSKGEESQIIPVSDNVQALKQLIQYLRMEWPNLYDNFIGPKRELIKGRPLDELVTADTVSIMTQQLLSKVQSWQLLEQQRTVFILKIMEILAFQETSDLRIRISTSTDEFSRLKLLSEYWDRVLELVIKHQWLQEKSKSFKAVVNVIKQKVATINNKIGDAGEGVLQFYLSGGTLADFFKGWISRDCTRNTDTEEDHPHFWDTQAFTMDPGCFLFKVIEKNKWVGNVYAFTFKDKDGKQYLYLDMFQLNLEHPITKSNDDWKERRVEFCSRFIKQLMDYLGSQGFDYLLVSGNPAQHKIGPDILTVLKRDYGKASTDTLSLKKLGGTEFFSDAGVGEEYVQTISGNYINNSFQVISGYKLSLDKTTPQAIQERQTELDYIEKLLGEMSAEETRLLALVKEKQTELKQINQKGQEAVNSGKSAMASALMAASEQKKAEIQKIQYELGELKAKMQEKKQEVDHLRVDLGMFKAGSNASSPLGKALLSISFIGMLNLFLSQSAQAQDMSSLDRIISSSFAPLLVITGITGLFGLFYILNKLFPEEPKYEPYHGMSTYRLSDEYRLPQDVNEQLTEVLSRVSPALQSLIPKIMNIHLPFEVGIKRSQAIKALKLLFTTLIENVSVLDFLKTHSFYQNFKQRARELGLADDFDQPKHEYSFSIAKEEIQQEEDRRAEEFIENALAKLKKEYREVFTVSILQKISDRKSYLKRRGFDRAKEIEFYEYYLLLKTYAYSRFQDKLTDASSLSVEHKYLEALSLLEEFLRVGIGAELIALEPDANLRDALNRILSRELEGVHWQFNRLTASQVKKEQTFQATRDIQYSVVLSSRSADDVLRGVVSGDCTAINGSAFYNTIPQFLFDPGFLSFKILQNDKWVGNVYAVVAEKDNNPVLIIDAIQLPVWGRTWPVSVAKLSDKALEKVVEYAQEQGFAQVLMSSFVSNFNVIHEHLGSQYPVQAIEIEKVAGFEHLKALGLWDKYASRNEYLETFSPQWNYGLKQVDPNNPRQTLLLRRIWERGLSSQYSEEPPVESNKASSPLNQDIRSQKDKSGLSRFIQRNLRKFVFVAALFIMLTVPNIANAARFEVIQGAQSNQAQVVAVVEIGDSLWNIAGVAYNGVEGIGQAKYAAHVEWPRIYENEINQEKVLAGRQHKLGSQYSDTQQIVNIRPGDKLVVPGPVNYEAIGLKAPTPQAETRHSVSEARPTVSEVKPPEVVAPSQQQIQVQQELQNLQQQKFQAGQELNQLQQQGQTAQADLENLQREKAEITRQTLDLKKQLVDIQEQLRQTKEKIPPNLRSEEARHQVLEQETGQLEQKKAQYAQETATFEKENKEAQEELSRITAQKEKAAQELDQLRQQSPQAQTKIKDLQAEIQHLEGQKKQHQQELSQLQNQRDELQKGIEQLDQNKDKLREELKGLKQQVGQAKDILEGARQKAQPNWQNLWGGMSWSEKSGIILLLLTGIGAAAGGIILTKRWTKFKRLQRKIERLQKEVKNAEARLGALRAEEGDIVKMREDAEKANLEVEEGARKVAAQQAQLEMERKRLEQEAQDLQKQKEEIDKQRHELVDLNKQKQTVRADIEQLKNQSESLRESLAQAQEEAQQAIDRAREQEERIKAQTKATAETLTEEQLKLQEQLEVKRQEIAAEVVALEDRLKQAQTKHGLDIQQIEREKAAAQVGLDDLVGERESMDAKLTEMKEALADLNRNKDNLNSTLREQERKSVALQKEIESLEGRKKTLEAEAIELKPVEEEKPKIDELLEEVIRVDEEANALLGKIAPLSDTHIHRAVIKQIEGMGIKNIHIESIPIISHSGHNNIIVKIPASDPQYEHLPKIILNAHMDTVRNDGFWFIFRGRKEPVKSGALDDRVGIVAILQSLRMLKQKWDSGKIPHGPIWVIFTDLEETPFVGSADLKKRHETNSDEHFGFFNNTHVIITVDGPLDKYKGTNNPLGEPLGLVLLRPELSDYPQYYSSINDCKHIPQFQAIYRAGEEAAKKTIKLAPWVTPQGGGDEGNFSKILDEKGEFIRVANMRAPHTGYHERNETTDIENQLVPVIEWLTESVLRLNEDLIGLKQTSAIVMRSKEGDQTKTIWEYKIKDGLPLPESYQLGPLSMVALNSLSEVLVKLGGFYSKRDIDRIRTIKIVTGNDRLAVVDREKGEIVLDINAFASESLLLMEIEHELWHLILGSRGVFTELAMEELTIVYFEVLRFLSLTAEQQDEIIGVLKADNDIDDQQFYKLLTEARDCKGALERIIPNIINYLIRVKIPTTQFIENLRNSLRDKMESLSNYPTSNFRIDSLIDDNSEFKPFLRLIYYFEGMLGVENLKERAQKGEELGYAGEFVEGKIRQYYGMVGRNLFSFNLDKEEDLRLLDKIIDIFYNKPITDVCLDSIRNWAGYGYARNEVADLFARLLVNINGVSAAERLKDFLNKRDANNNNFALAISELVLIRLDESTIPLLIEFLKNDSSFYIQRNIFISEMNKRNDVYLRSLYFHLIDLLRDDKIKVRELAVDLLGALHEKRIFREDGGSAKGQGMFAPEEHAEVNEVISAAQREERGLLIWGDAHGWKQAGDGYTQDITWAISSLKRYSTLRIPGLGVVDIPEVLAASNIVLIQPRNNSPPGLVVKSSDSYQIAHSGEAFNSIYIDEKIYKQLYSFEIAVLLAHEAIELYAKRLAREKRIPWTIDLAKQVHRLAEEYEIQIVGRSSNGRGSRFDARIEEILGFNKPKPKPKQEQAKLVKDESPVHEAKLEKPEPVVTPQAKPVKPEPIVTPSPQPKLQEEKPKSHNNSFSLDFPDIKNSIIDSLRGLFLEGMFRDTSNFPAKFEDFPPPMAREIKDAHDLGKITGMPLDPDLLTALTVFFSRIFPNHANELINYLRTLDIYIINNARSTFGATLSGNTFYIQRSCLEDLLGRPISVEEIKEGIKNKDKEILVALFRIIIHEIGSAFFKLSHPANQELEELFLAILSKNKLGFSLNMQQEIHTVNRTTNLDNMARIDWAQKRNRSVALPDDTVLKLDNLLPITEELTDKLISLLYDANQGRRNNAAEVLARLGIIKALPFLKLLQEKEPQNEIIKEAIKILEQKAKEEVSYFTEKGQQLFYRNRDLPYVIGIEPDIMAKVLTVEDAVGSENIFTIMRNGLSTKESDSKFRERLSAPSVKEVVKKMGKDGLYDYYKDHRPDFYQSFLNEVKAGKFSTERHSLSPGFNRPGPSFSLFYVPMPPPSSSYPGFVPIFDKLGSFNMVMEEIKVKHPELYKLFYKAQDGWIPGSGSKNLNIAVDKLYNLLCFYPDMPIVEKADYIITLFEISSFEEAGEIRVTAISAGSAYYFSPGPTCVRYWEYILEKITNRFSSDSVLFEVIQKNIGDRINLAELSYNKKGRLSFNLSGKTPFDFFRDYAEGLGDSYSQPLLINHVVDPAVLLFKIKEGSNWVGNMYACVLKDKKGNNILLVDRLSLDKGYQLELSDKLKDKTKLTSDLLDNLVSFAAERGFDAVILDKRFNIQSSLIFSLARIGEKSQLVELTLRKAGGLGYYPTLGLEHAFEYYMESLKSGEDYCDVSGYRININSEPKTKKAILKLLPGGKLYKENREIMDSEEVRGAIVTLEEANDYRTLQAIVENGQLNIYPRLAALKALRYLKAYASLRAMHSVLETIIENNSFDGSIEGNIKAEAMAVLEELGLNEELHRTILILRDTIIKASSKDRNNISRTMNCLINAGNEKVLEEIWPYYLDLIQQNKEETGNWDLYNLSRMGEIKLLKNFYEISQHKKEALKALLMAVGEGSDVALEVIRGIYNQNQCNVLTQKRTRNEGALLVLIDDQNQLVEAPWDPSHTILVKRVCKSTLKDTGNPNIDIMVLRGPKNEPESVGLMLRKIVKENSKKAIVVSVQLQGYNPSYVSGVLPVELVKELGGEGVVFVIGAGNGSMMETEMQSNLDNVLVVASYKEEIGVFKKAPYSNYGVDIFCCADGNYDLDVSGTSFASPRIAIILSSLLASNPQQSVPEIISILKNMAVPMNSEPLFKKGLLGVGAIDSSFIDFELLNKKKVFPGKANVATNLGGIDLSKIEITLKDEKFVSSLNPVDLKILRAARALKQGQNSLAVLYVHEIRLILEDNIVSEKDITQKALLQNLLSQLEHKELLNLEAVAFSHIIQGEVIFSEDKLLSSIGRIK